MADDEFTKDIQELVEADKALTQGERDRAWRANKLSMYRDQLQRQLEYLDKGVPGFLIAMNAVNQYRVASSLWEEEVLKLEIDNKRDRRRRSSGVCVRCACAIPAVHLPPEGGHTHARGDCTARRR